MRLLLWLGLLLLSVHAAVADPFADCAEHLPFGVPKPSGGASATPVCHKGYIALVDNVALVPRWVAYRLTAKHALGCLGRTNNFHQDEALPPAHRAKPSDYEGSGYDQGHLAPADDYGWSIETVRESFSMANMAPQLPGLNRNQWKRLEETVRAWAWKRGDLIVYVGTVLSAHPKTIGADHVAVPVKFWKVVADLKTGDVLAFEMPQKAIKIGKLEPWEVTVVQVEQDAGLQLPLPPHAHENAKPALWTADLKGRAAAEKAKCQ